MSNFVYTPKLNDGHFVPSHKHTSTPCILLKFSQCMHVDIYVSAGTHICLNVPLSTFNIVLN